MLAGCLDGQAGWLAGIAIEVEFEVASRWAINAIIAIIINARTSEAVAVAVAVPKGNQDGCGCGSGIQDPCCCHYPGAGPGPGSSMQMLFLLLLWAHNCQRNKFSILLKHHSHYKCNVVVIAGVAFVKDIQGAEWLAG